MTRRRHRTDTSPEGTYPTGGLYTTYRETVIVVSTLAIDATHCNALVLTQSEELRDGVSCTIVAPAHQHLLRNLKHFAIDTTGTAR